MPTHSLEPPHTGTEGDPPAPRRWLRIEIVVLGLIAALAVYFEPNRVARGWLAGEDFFHGRPTSYWRKVLRHVMVEGGSNNERFHELASERAAIPVLLACARDGDAESRLPAFSLIIRSDADLRDERVLSVCLAGLRDPDARIRLVGLSVAYRLRERGRLAVPAIAALLYDTDMRVAREADNVFWNIDADARVQEMGWKQFTAPEFGFSVMVPSEPEYEKRLAPGCVTITHFFRTRFEASEYCVVVSDSAHEFAKATTGVERFRALRNGLLLPPDAEFVDERPFERHGEKGWELIYNTDRERSLYVRLMWQGRRLYQIQTLRRKEMPSDARADQYFLDSFRIEPKSAAGP